MTEKVGKDSTTGKPKINIEFGQVPYGIQRKVVLYPEHDENGLISSFCSKNSQI